MVPNPSLRLGSSCSLCCRSSLVGREALVACFNASTKYISIVLISIYPFLNHGMSHVILALKVIDKSSTMRLRSHGLWHAPFGKISMKMVFSGNFLFMSNS